MRKFKGMWRLMAILILAFTVLAGCADDIPSYIPADDEISISEETGGGFNDSEQQSASEMTEADRDEDESSAIGPTPTPEPSDETGDVPDAEPEDAAQPTEEALPTEVPAVEETEAEPLPEATPTEAVIAEDGEYTSKKDVALYIHTYGKLPGNFITKKDAQALGWSGGSLEPYAPGKSIGGDRFGNYEGLLPDGRYKECDIDTKGKKSRGSKRIVFDDKGNIYYTSDHYESFTQLY